MALRVFRKRDVGLTFTKAELALGLAGKTQTRRLLAIEDADLRVIGAADAGNADAQACSIRVGPRHFDALAARNDLLKAFGAEQCIPDLLPRRRNIDLVLPAQVALQRGPRGGRRWSRERRLP